MGKSEFGVGSCGIVFLYLNFFFCEEEDMIGGIVFGGLIDVC